jgi:Ribbon-helix-helix protein, copG family
MEMKVVKDAAISIRVEQALKERLDAAAAAEGMTLAAFVERALEVHSHGGRLPTWMLIYPEVNHSAKTGTTIKLPVANGWPLALLPIEHAEMLGKQLLQAVDVAKRTLAAPDVMKGYTTDPDEADRIRQID